MSKREKAARATGAADADATDVDTADTDTPDTDAADTTDGAVTMEKRPTGKRSATPRGKRAAAAGGDSSGEGSGGGVALKERPEAASEDVRRRNPFARLLVFLGEVVAEMRKVIWPTRTEMVQYTIIVLIFVVIMTAFISGIDLGFARLVLWLFG